MYRPFTTDLAKRETLSTMIGTYQQATRNIEEAYAILETAEKSLRAVFLDAPGYRFSANDLTILMLAKLPVMPLLPGSRKMLGQ